MKKRIITRVLLLASTILLFAFTAAHMSSRIQITRSVNTFAEILKTLDRVYVDSLDFTRLSKVAIDAMLKEVDPYTEYYSEDDLQRASLITRGEYAGIGTQMQERNGSIIIRHVYEGSPAHASGIQPADEVTRIDGQSVKGWGIDRVTAYLKGNPGEKVKLDIRRPGSTSLLTVDIERQVIKMPIIPYAGVQKGDVGYLKLSSFSSENTADEFKSALEDLLSHGAKTLLIDLRNNGGGRMDHAIRICSYFLPERSLILTMKGKQPENVKEFYTQTAPIVPMDMPVVVMVNGNTASASEIVSGALQDYDRAVILGERSFGKGLVQTVANMPYRAQMKYTNAKYYIPSGRCVQAIKYDHSTKELVTATVPDSLLKPFKTKSGRTVYEGSGIMPDKKVDFVIQIPESFAEMDRQGLFFDYATEYRLLHKSIAKIEQFDITPVEIAGFEAFLKRKTFTFSNASQRQLDSLITQSKADGVYDRNQETLKKLKQSLATDVRRDLEKNQSILKQRLAYELLSRYYGDAAVIQYQLREDKQYGAAVQLLSDRKAYDLAISTTHKLSN